MSPLLVLAVVLLTGIYLYRLAYNKPHNFPPGPPRLPLYGSYWLLLWQNYRFLHVSLLAMARRYRSSLVGFYLGDFPCVVATDYSTCREVLLRPEFQGRPDIIVARTRNLGERYGVIFTDGPQWSEQRRFFLRHMRDFGFARRFEASEAVMQEEVQDLIQLLHGDWADEAVVRDGCVLFSRLFGPFAVSAVWSMFGGERFHGPEHHRLRLVVDGAIQFMRATDASGGAVSLTPWLRFTTPRRFGLQDVEDFNKQMLDLCRSALLSHKATFSEDHMRDFIDMYVDKMRTTGDSTVFTDDQFLVVGMDLLLATSTALPGTMTFLFHCLIQHPGVQRRIQQEVDAVVGRDKLPTLDDRHRMPYLEATVREAMRRVTIAPLSVPHVATEDTQLNGYFIPKNTLVYPHLWAVHMDSDTWGDPEAFRPDRFLDADGRLKKDLSMPFGAGKRLCTGETFSRQMMFLMTAAMMQSFRFEPVSTAPQPPMDWAINGFNLTAPDIWARIMPRG